MPRELFTRADRMRGIAAAMMKQGNQSPGARLAEMQQFAARSGTKMNMEQALQFVKNQRQKKVPRAAGIPGQTARPFKPVKAPPSGRIPKFRPGIAQARRRKMPPRSPAMVVLKAVNQLLFLFSGERRLAALKQKHPRVMPIRAEIVKRAIERVQKKQFPSITIEDVTALYKALQ